MKDLAMLAVVQELLKKYNPEEHSVEFGMGYTQALKDLVE